MGVGAGTHGFADSLGQAEGSFAVGVGKEHGKLVAANTGGQVAGPGHAAAHRFGNMPEAGIAAQMAGRRCRP